MFEENENLVLDNTENVDEQTTEEIVDGGTEPEGEPQDGTQEPVKTYTEEELNARVDELLAKKIARKEAKIRKEYEEKYSPYKEAESVLNAGLGTSNITEATNNLREFYSKKGVNIPKYEPSYNENDMKVLANAEANSIIESGFDEVVEEVDRLAEKGVDNMTPREKLVFTKLAEYRKAEGSRKELASIGVKNEVIDSKEFKDFSSQFNSEIPITKVYELYTKTLDKPQIEKIGSMKNGNTQEEKVYYTPEEVDKLTEKDFDDPKIFQKVRESMAKWK